MRTARKWQAVAIVAMMVFITVSCTINVPEANIYVEAADGTNDSTPEDTGFAFSGGAWYQIDGTFNTTSDGDEYRVDLSGSVTGFSELRVYHNDKEEKDGLVLGINDFPLAVYTYTASDAILVNYLAAASGDGIDWSDDGDVAYVIIRVYAVTEDVFGNSLPFSTGSYTVQFQ